MKDFFSGTTTTGTITISLKMKDFFSGTTTTTQTQGTTTTAQAS
jgi:hypothetical protein